ncbi:MAG: ComF family protein [Alphaproteobacteria bacterium]|nr:ComF family protein [Alphaproteobacteria bacterium]
MELGEALQRSALWCLDTLLPPRCLGCGVIVEGTSSLCADCWRHLTFLGPPLCRLCGYPLPRTVAEMPVCGACAVQPPTFARARAALRYDDGARGMILRFKHADRTDIARTFGRMLENAGAELLADCDLIAPVPLHRWRLLQRGYNQAALLARALAGGGRRAVIPDLLQRVQATASQQGLSGEERKRNVKAGAFRVHPRHRARLAGRRILLIDDVLTTGATVGACTRVLTKGGAAAVDVLALARVVRDAGDTISSDDALEAMQPPDRPARDGGNRKRSIRDAQS